MSWSGIIYLAGMLAMFVVERLMADHPLEWGVRGAAIAALLFAIGLRIRALPKAAGEGLRQGQRIALVLLVVGCSSLLIYYGTTDDFVRGLSLDEKAEARYLGSMKSLWPMVWLLGTIPLLVIDNALASSPVVLPVARIREALAHGLVAAMGIALVFPINYIASEKNERWDLAYFKTPQPGTATQKLVEALQEPVKVRIFMPPSSEVAMELRNYFAPLEGDKLTVEILDQAAQPRLAKALAIRDNGTIALTTGDISVLMDDPKEPDEEGAEPEDETDDRAKPVTRRVRVNPEFEKAKRTLKKIDREVQKALIELGQGERIAYLTTGHGEIDWSGGDEEAAMSIRAYRRALLDLGFKVKTLSLAQGLGEKVPDDASVVLVIGPRRQFHGAEVNSLRNYLHAGGSLLIAMPPKLALDGQPAVADPMDALLEEMGVQRGEGMLASERNIVVISHQKDDRFNTFSNSFTSHPSSRELADMGKRDVFFSPGAGFLEEVDGHDSDVTFTVRSLSTTWADVNLNAELDSDAGESKAVRNLVAAISGGGEDAKWRAIVMLAPAAFVDLSVLRFLANQQFALDSINWLIGAEDLTGTTESEEDVKIEHTKEGQTTWFYGTVLGVPMLVLGLGAVRIRLRRKPRVVAAGADAPPPTRPTPARKPAAAATKPAADDEEPDAPPDDDEPDEDEPDDEESDESKEEDER